MENNKELVEKIYKILTQRKFRNGPLPVGDRKKFVLGNIQNKVAQGKAIEFLQFWGGSKNINLPTCCVDLCEQATLDNLNNLNNEVVAIYKPGLLFHIVPGDERVEYVNYIPKERTADYVKTLAATTQKYNRLFTVTPIADLHEKYKTEFEIQLKEAEKLSDKICKLSLFKKWCIGARNNIYYDDLKTDEEITARATESAKRYCIYRAAEEKAEIFRDFDNCIRSYFVKVIPFYDPINMGFDDVNKTKPNINCSLLFYTGRKGNITQPWQAVSKTNGDKMLFLSQKRLKDYLANN